MIRLKLDHASLVGLLVGAAAITVLVLAALIGWWRHRKLGTGIDRQRERERRAYWGFE